MSPESTDKYFEDFKSRVMWNPSESVPGPFTSNFTPSMVQKYGSILAATDSMNIVRPLADEARKGDLFRILLGCAMPVYLRHRAGTSGKYVLYGEVYVPGIMQGEALIALRKGKLEVQDFILCIIGVAG
jgi:hypothetical protein